MRISKILWAVVTALTFVLTSCDRVTDEPTIEGKVNKFFDSQAQRKSFRVLTASGKPYNHKIDWHIIGILDPKSENYLTKKIDTLSNGDLKISYDWVAFIVRENKSVIDVEVQKNETGQDRSVDFVAQDNHKGLASPSMTVIQRAK